MEPRKDLPMSEVAGKPNARNEVDPSNKEEEILMVETINRVGKAVRLWLTEGIDMAMNRQNGTAEQAAQSQPSPKKQETPSTEEKQPED